MHILICFNPSIDVAKWMGGNMSLRTLKLRKSRRQTPNLETYFRIIFTPQGRGDFAAAPFGCKYSINVGL